MKSLKIHAISDTHGKQKYIDLPGGDILIHAGDATPRGSISDIIGFLNWFQAQPYTHKICISGNHDWGWEKNGALLEEEAKKRGIIYLNDSGVEIEGVHIWGSPVQPWFHHWAFNRYRGPDIKRHWDLIPENTELLITHGPPMDILDFTLGDREHVGCQDLKDRIIGSKVKCHIFGHIHEGRGTLDFMGTLFVNASCLNENYQVVSTNCIEIIRDEDGGYSS